MMSLEGLSVIDITAFADRLCSAFEARILRSDLNPEVSVAFHAVVDLAVVANLTVAAFVLAVIEFVVIFAAVVATVVPE